MALVQEFATPDRRRAQEDDEWEGGEEEEWEEEEEEEEEWEEEEEEEEEWEYDEEEEEEEEEESGSEERNGVPLGGGWGGKKGRRRRRVAESESTRSLDSEGTVAVCGLVVLEHVHGLWPRFSFESGFILLDPDTLLVQVFLLLLHLPRCFFRVLVIASSFPSHRHHPLSPNFFFHLHSLHPLLHPVIVKILFP